MLNWLKRHSKALEALGGMATAFAASETIAVKFLRAKIEEL